MNKIILIVIGILNVVLILVTSILPELKISDTNKKLIYILDYICIIFSIIIFSFYIIILK